MTWDVSSGPGVTALGLAAARSVESGRSDRLIEDPFARALFEAADADLPMRLDWPDPGSPVSDTEMLHLHGSRYIGLRTRFYDDAIGAAAEDGLRQVVLVGAGLDTRAFRLSLPADLRVFELDQEGVLGFKDEVLSGQAVDPRCARSAIPIDLRDDWPSALHEGGFDSTQPTAWVAEGLLPYLPPEAQSNLVAQVRGLSAPGSTLAFDRIVGDAAAGARLRGLSERSGIDIERLLAGGDADDLGGLLSAGGWEVEEQPTASIAERYLRDLSDPFATPDDGSRASEPPWLDTVFLTARLPIEAYT
jgi:methyltransferase (TIGR00027 family)